ncbi:MAG: hypothetical protein IT169_12190 [Bryobacterales bacterium]|nr:hypothetical protein [Bryobacterales bacterium]
MMYFLNRGGTRYGPYTPDDVRRYLASGNIAPEDRLEPEGGGLPLTAAQLTQLAVAQPFQNAPFAESGVAEPMGGAGLDGGFHRAPQALGAPGFGAGYPMQPMVSAIPAQIPPPPGMDWWLVLILSICTCTLFGYIWSIVQSRWVKKLDPGSRATLYLLLPLLLIPAVIAIAIGGGIAGEVAGHGDEVIGGLMAIPVLVLSLGAAIASIAGFISMSSSLSEATAHWGAARIDLGGIFTVFVVIGWLTNLIFLIAPVWIQYRLDEVRRLQTWGGARPR